MKRSRFLITSLLTAGFGIVDEAQATYVKATTTGGDDPERQGLLRMFRLDHKFNLASHASHSSHSSHASHSSGSGGGTSVYTYPSQPVYVPPAPAPAPSPAPAPRPRGLFSLPSGPYVAPSPATTALHALRGGTERFNSIVRRVQLGLLAYGYYEGTIDGVVGPGMKTSLRRFQTDFKLPVTGTITPETLDALKITAE